MAFFEGFSQKAKDVAGIAADKAKDVAYEAADMAKDTAEWVKVKVAIAGERRELEKNYRIIGEWFTSEYDGELPEAVREPAEAAAAAKERIAELEASLPVKEAEDFADEEASELKACPVCGAESDSRFCPQCGAPLE